MNEASGGEYTQKCQHWLTGETGGHALLTPSATAALEAGILLAGVRDGDEVILPSFAYPTCASAIIRAGGTPVFVDIEKDTLNISPWYFERAIGPKTIAVMPIYYAGVAPNVEVYKIAAANGIKVIEDAAQAIGNYQLKGDFGAISFHFTKNISCGEGGALIFGPEHAKEAKTLCFCGTNRWNDRKNWTWIGVGSSYIISELLAQRLWARLPSTGMVNEQRRRIWNIYYERIAADWKATHSGNGHLFWFCTNQQAELLAKMPFLVKHYEALHRTQPGLRFGRYYDHCGTSIDAAESIVRPPMTVSEPEAIEISNRINQILMKEAA